MEPQFAALVESGEMQFTYKDYVLPGHKPHAQWAAEAAHCAADQGKFWAYRATLFSNQKRWTKADLKLYAEKLELDTTQFNQCFDSGKHKAEVEKSSKEAVESKLPGTPSYLINGTQIDIRAYETIDEFMQRLKEEIAKAK